MKKTQPKVIYYKDELNDEFSSAEITPRKIGGDYKYERNSVLDKILHFLLYRIVEIPVAFCYLKLKFGHKIVNRQAIKPYLGKGCFIFGNHTQALADPCVPTFITFPHRANIVVHPNNVSIKIIGKCTPYLGAIPLPDDMAASRNFLKCIESRLKKNQAIFIYPEAHIWPYFTGIRNFPSASFHYPVKYNTPVFCFTNTYKARKHRKTPRMVTYVDGPFFPNEELPLMQRKTELRDRVYACMCKRAENSDVNVVEYRKEKTDD
jgi:1-acyl-sn-glycerol-3-phosphate acyltransferase